MSYDVETLRTREYPWTATGDQIYLNSASTGAMPKRTIDASVELTRRRTKPYQIPDAEIFATLSRCRALAARMINAHESEIALMPNTSCGINLAANSIPFAEGDVILTFEREFPANVYPWLAQRRRGARLEFVPCIDGLPNEEAMYARLDAPGVKAVAVSWVSFASGYQVDLQRLSRECRARNIFLAIDGIQGLGPLTLDVQRTPVDFFACGGQKWLVSPWGTGFTYVRRELIQTLDPPDVGWLAFTASQDFANLTRYDFNYLPDARRFEVGTIALQDFAALNESLELFHSLGEELVSKHIGSLTRQLADWAQGCACARMLSPADPARRAGIVSLGFSDPPKVASALRDAGVAFSMREGAIRLAPNLFNSASEIVRCIAVMEAAAG